MLLRPSTPIRAVVSALCALAFSTTAYALERITLTTGFSYDCVRHEPADADHTKLYIYSPQAAQDSENFILIATQQIASVDTLPDPPRPTPVAFVAPTAQPAASADVHELLARAGSQHNIDVELLASVIKAESNGNAKAVSRTGARGLMQLMPGTARDLGVNDAFKPDQNIAGGAKYLDLLLTYYKNDLSKALAAYNAGPAAVDRYHGIPPYRETRAYVARVEKEFIRRTAAAQKAAAQNSTTAVATAVLP